MAPNKMQHQFCHQFSNVVFYALSSGTLGFALHGSFDKLTWKNLIGYWRISTNQKMVYSYRNTMMESNTAGTTWKSIKNFFRNWCQKWCCILFGVIYWENKQWLGKKNEIGLNSTQNKSKFSISGLKWHLIASKYLWLAETWEWRFYAEPFFSGQSHAV